MPDLSGEILDGRYQLGELIASGGMAAIYAATDLRLDRTVAVKVMHDHLANDESFVNRFIREAKATASLNHPNVVAIQDQGWNEGGVQAVFLVMEFMDGFTLRQVMTERGAMSPAATITYLLPILSALAAAHKIGIVHRDVKPENILISKDGRVKVGDFGLARGVGLGKTMTADASVILGSVSYLSPEQVQRGITDARSDLYSLGILAFEMLVGRKPYEGESAIQIAYRHVNEQVPPPSNFVSGISSSLDKLVQSMTAVDPDQRPKDAGVAYEMVLAIQSELDPDRPQLSLELDLPNTDRSTTPKKKPRPQVRVGARNDLNPMNANTVVSKPAVREDTGGTKPKTSREKRKKKSTRRFVVLIVLLALIGGAAAWYEYSGPGSKISIPSLVGLSAKEADAALTPLGLHSTVLATIFSEDVARGRVITSNPGGGAKIAAGGNIDLTVSKGKERLSVPTLIGLSVTAAQAQILSAGLKLGNVTSTYNSKVAKNAIISESPKGGTKVRRDTLVNFVVSQGAQQVAAVSYVGLSGDQALNELTTAGFKVTTTYVYSDTFAAGAVISQTPAGGTTLDKGSAISLLISQGPESVYIPNVFSLTAENATRTLENLQLQVIVKSMGTKKIKTVTHISPAIGTKVKRGSTVVITVG